MNDDHLPATGWTIDELADRVTATLADLAVPAPSGRVTAVPDRRLIRWYATIGLLDPPLRTRGRVARYGERHLLQLVAVKRRQAQGRTLAEIQAELTGATDAMLRGAAGLPESGPLAAGAAEGRSPDPHDGSPHSRAGSPDPHGGDALDGGADRAGIRDDAVRRRGPAGPGATGPARGSRRDGFWREGPSGDPAPVPATYHRPPFAPVSVYGKRYPTAPSPSRSDATVRPVFPVPLREAATLVLHVAPTADDLAAIRAAAGPLLDVLADRGLLPDRHLPPDRDLGPDRDRMPDRDLPPDRDRMPDPTPPPGNDEHPPSAPSPRPRRTP